VSSVSKDGNVSTQAFSLAGGVISCSGQTSVQVDGWQLVHQQLVQVALQAQDAALPAAVAIRYVEQGNV
jgi:hypothetical protein